MEMKLTMHNKHSHYLTMHLMHRNGSFNTYITDHEPCTNMTLITVMGKYFLKSFRLYESIISKMSYHMKWKGMTNPNITHGFPPNRVDVFVTLEFIHLYILCLVPRCLFREVPIMYLSHVMPRCSYREVLYHWGT